jgi:allantoate deiminase
MQRCDALGAISDEPGRLTRTFHSPAMQRANALVGSWMREAGLDVREDAAFNLIGRCPSDRRHARTLLLGSHLDTVRDAGKYDGPLGVLVALAALQHAQHVLRERAPRDAGGLGNAGDASSAGDPSSAAGPSNADGPSSAGRGAARRARDGAGVDARLGTGRALALPFHVEIAGFSDEEGVRYQTTYLGSRAMAGTLSRGDLARVEEKGIERARRRRGEFIGYVEAHIEQGPVLEQHDLPVAVVSAIAGQSRIRVELRGRAGHAGTTPMEMRQDALCGAAEIVLAAERCGVMATVGQMSVEPGASNVIPGHVVLSLDVRHASDRRREAAVRRLRNETRAIARRRGLRVSWTMIQETAAVRCDPDLTRLLARAVARHSSLASQRALARLDSVSAQAAGISQAPARDVLRLPSGAGHDAAALAAICSVAMLFVRCRGGVSHHPDESVKRTDVATAIGVLADFILAFADHHRHA